MNEAVHLENVSVSFTIVALHHRALKAYLLEIIKRKKRESYQFWALRDLDATIYHGDVVAIIGHNGAGKSTLLRVISGVLLPTGGTVRVQGKISPIMDVDAAFAPDLTGMENIYLSASMLGLSRREIIKKLPAIIEFSGLEEFIHAPTRIYSTGMRARLGFSIATEVEPDILIIDEALSVGDISFQEKCVARIEEFQKRGATILFVTHDEAQVRRMAKEVIWLEHGVVRAVGEPDSVLKQYKRARQSLTQTSA